MVSGIVPVYAGADDISDYVPQECFIPYQRFQNPEEMMEYLKAIDEKQYKGYLNAIRNFLNSDQTKVFDGEEYARDVYYLTEHAYLNTFRVDKMHRIFFKCRNRKTRTCSKESKKWLEVFAAGDRNL